MGINLELKKLKNNDKAKILQRFFKTGKGQYGEGDFFLGITVPQQREIANKFWNKLSLKELEKLLFSKFHEERLTAFLILVKKYEHSEEKIKKNIVRFYLKNLHRANNWDLIDLTASKILGSFLLNKDKRVLYKLAKSKNIWERRASIVSTFSFIYENQFQDTMKISEILLADSHDLIQKAVGWMLREVGKRDIKILEFFLEKNYKKISRTTLRYSIEKMPEIKRQYYLRKQ
jgi:3-methyladenine DNA glycosylase AlkD